MEQEATALLLFFLFCLFYLQDCFGLKGPWQHPLLAFNTVIAITHEASEI